MAFSNRSGLVAVELAKGVYEIDASLGRSRSRTIGVLLSIAGFVALSLQWVLASRRHRPTQTSGTD